MAIDKAEVVRAAIAHRECGAVPYHISLTGEGLDAYGDRLLADYPDERVREDLAAGRIDKSQAVSLAIGNHQVYVNPPWWGWHGIGEDFTNRDETPDWLPDTVGYGAYEAFFERAAYLRGRYGVYLVALVYGSHWEKAYAARGLESFLMDLVGSPEWAQSLLDLIIRKNLVMLENILAVAQVDAVLLGSDWGTQRDLIMSPQCFRQMIKPGEKREYDLVKRYGRHVFVHSCGCVTRILGDLVELGLDVLNPVQPECMDLRFLKETYGDKLTFFGGISTQRTLPYGTPREVAAETRATVELMAKGGGYITSPSQDIQTDVPYENLRALIDTAREFA